jgi:hypothetical protein
MTQLKNKIRRVVFYTPVAVGLFGWMVGEDKFVVVCGLKVKVKGNIHESVE